MLNVYIGISSNIIVLMIIVNIKNLVFSLTSLPFCHRLSHAQRSAVKVLRRMQYFVARRKFQVRFTKKPQQQHQKTTRSV